MSVQVMAWVMQHAPSSLTGTEQSVAIALANYADNAGGHAYPSIKQLVAITHWAERTVQSALRALVEKGVIEVEREATHGLPAMYRFTAFRGAGDAPGGCSRFTPEVQEMHPWGAGDAPKPSVRNHQERDTPPTPPEKTETTAEQSFAFWWAAYPKGRGAKATALAEWQRLTAEERKAAYIGLRHWLAAPGWASVPKYVVHANRWLKQRCWEDEPPDHRDNRAADVNAGGRMKLVT